MTKLRRWTVFYPDKTKEVLASARVTDPVKQEHWYCLMKTALENQIIGETLEEFEQRSGLIGEMAYQNYILANYMYEKIPVFQYIEEEQRNIWFYVLRIPEDLSKLNRFQLLELKNKMKKFHECERKGRFSVGYFDDSGVLTEESDLSGFSSKLYQTIYGSWMKMEDREEQHRRR